MCGIVGYVGARQAEPLLLDGLRRLEYRGYDSAGVAVLAGANLRACLQRVGQARTRSMRWVMAAYIMVSLMTMSAS